MLSPKVSHGVSVTWISVKRCHNRNWIRNSHWYAPTDQARVDFGAELFAMRSSLTHLVDHLYLINATERDTHHNSARRHSSKQR
jgi:hypothetical protein